MAAEDDDKWTRVVAKLITDTRGRHVKWTSLTSDSTNALAITLAQATSSYLASIDDKGFRMDYVTEREGALSKRMWRLSIVNAQGALIKRVPVTSGLSDLARAIQDQIAQVDEFLDKYLSS